MRVEVIREERYWYPEDGGIVWIAGLHPVDAGRRFLGRDSEEVRERGLRICGVAGAAGHHAEVLQGDAVEPGRPLTLRRDPGNPHDPNAIAVETADGERAGWVPRETAAEIAPELDAGKPWSAAVLREHRASPRDPRTSLTMLLAPAETLDLVER